MEMVPGKIGVVKVRDKFGNKIENDLPQRPPMARRDFNLAGWRPILQERFQLNEEGDSVPIAFHAAVAREVGGRVLARYEIANVLKNFSRLSGDMELLQPCCQCHGDGFVGEFENGSAELCSVCDGYGIQISPLLLEIVRALNFLENPERVISQADVDRRLQMEALKREAETKKKALDEETAAKLSEARREKFRAIEAKSFEQVAKEKAAIDRELQEQLAKLE